ncbi:MAG: glutamyl-tRNA reductase [Alphaproteobacteria bacterium]|nr:glutamyl-tRNA reductase [Alphaproteobacteria bacterium]
MTAAAPGSSPSPSGTPRLARLVVAGVDHLTAGQGLRDRLFVEAPDLPDFYSRLGAAGLDEGVLVATCDRVIVIGASEDPDRGAAAIRHALAGQAGLKDQDLEGSFFARTGAEALEHFFSIAASLESQVLGEPEVLGQVKAAQRAAETATQLSRELASVFEATYAVAKRVRSETAIGENAVSIAAAACQVAREVLGRFAETRCLLVGAGEAGVLVAEKLKDQGLADLWVADPLGSRGDALAARLGAHRLAMEDIAGALHRMDLVLAGLGGAVPVITREATAQALKQRRFRPIFLLDAAVPADVEPDVAGLDGAYLFNLQDLERIALQGQEKRSFAAIDARLIVEDEVAAFSLAEEFRAQAPAVRALRRHYEEQRRAVLEANPGVSADEATRLLVNRLLHGPFRALRELAADAQSGAGRAALDADLVARLFGVPAQRFDPPAGEDDEGTS